MKDDVTRKLGASQRFVDARGSITTLFAGEAWQEANLIESGAGAVRGGHYHEQTFELVVMLEGSVEVKVTPVADGPESVFVLEPGDVFRITPLVVHTFTTRTASRWLNFLSIAYDHSNPDVHRLVPP